MSVAGLQRIDGRLRASYWHALCLLRASSVSSRRMLLELNAACDGLGSRLHREAAWRQQPGPGVVDMMRSVADASCKRLCTVHGSCCKRTQPGSRSQ